MYDGTTHFDLASYDKLPCFLGDVPVGCAALVIFTLGRYATNAEKKKTYGLPDDHKWTLAFNAQAVIIVASKDKQRDCAIAPFTREHVHGVLVPDDSWDVSKPAEVKQDEVLNEVEEEPVYI